jgi:hypothetical protein
MTDPKQSPAERQMGEAELPASTQGAARGLRDMLLSLAVKCRVGYTMSKGTHRKLKDALAVSEALNAALSTASTAPAEPKGWTIIGPDGWTRTADKPITVLLEACRHETDIDPVEADRQATNLMKAIEEESAEHERDRAELVNRFLSWPLPDSVNADMCAARPGPYPPGRSGTNLLNGQEAAAMLAYVLNCDAGDRELAMRSAPAPQAAGATSEGLVEAIESFLLAQDSLDNREHYGVNTEPFETLMRRRNRERDYLDAALAQQEAQPDSHEKECEQAYASGFEFGKQIGRAEAQQEAQGEPVALTDERIERIADLTVKGMPDGIRGFMKEWGWRQFARNLAEIIVVPTAVAGEPQVPADVQRDAERYRWLRARLPGSAYRIAGVIYSEGGSGVDAAIDTAMLAASPQPTKGGV